jgi:hypothetical protein
MMRPARGRGNRPMEEVEVEVAVLWFMNTKRREKY